MFRFFRSLAARSKSARRPVKFRPDLESMENRELLSTNPLTAATFTSNNTAPEVFAVYQGYGLYVDRMSQGTSAPDQFGYTQPFIQDNWQQLTNPADFKMIATSSTGGNIAYPTVFAVVGQQLYSYVDNPAIDFYARLHTLGTPANWQALSAHASNDGSGGVSVFALDDQGNVQEYDALGTQITTMVQTPQPMTQITATANAEGQGVVFSVDQSGGVWEFNREFQDNWWHQISPNLAPTMIAATQGRPTPGSHTILNNDPGLANPVVPVLFAVGQDNQVHEYNPTRGDDGWRSVGAPNGATGFRDLSAVTDAGGFAEFGAVPNDGSLWDFNYATDGTNGSWEQDKPPSDFQSVTASRAHFDSSSNYPVTFYARTSGNDLYCFDPQAFPDSPAASYWMVGKDPNATGATASGAAAAIAGSQAYATASGDPAASDGSLTDTQASNPSGQTDPLDGLGGPVLGPTTDGSGTDSQSSDAGTSSDQTALSGLGGAVLGQPNDGSGADAQSSDPATASDPNGQSSVLASQGTQGSSQADQGGQMAPASEQAPQYVPAGSTTASVQPLPPAPVAQTSASSDTSLPTITFASTPASHHAARGHGHASRGHASHHRI
jgi:hypothetical protein